MMKGFFSFDKRVVWFAAGAASVVVYETVRKKGLIKAVATLGTAVVPKMVVERGLEGELETIEKQVFGEEEFSEADVMETLPESKGSKKTVVAVLEKACSKQAARKEQKWGGVYHCDKGEICEVQNAAMALFNSTNTLYPAVFPAVRRFEAEIIATVVDMVGGGKASKGGAERLGFPAPNACGILASGGSEAVFLAVLAHAKQHPRKKKVVACRTAHPAVKKACSVMGLMLVTVDVDADMRADVHAFKKHVDANTLLLYASAPTFSHGVVDPIAELATIAQSQGAGLHVDNCLGGFLLSHLALLDDADDDLTTTQTGRIPDFDLRVDGVTSMSVDVHKYGHASKGASVVVFRSPELRRCAYLPSFDGAEGLYVTPTLQGSRNGAIVAQAWATLKLVGRQGYLESAASLRKTSSMLIDLLESSFQGDIQPLVIPHAAVVPFVAGVNLTRGVCNLGSAAVYKVAAQMQSRGWNLFTGQDPPVASVCLGDQGLDLDLFAAHLRASVDAVKADPQQPAVGAAAVYGAMVALPDSVLDTLLRRYQDIVLSTRPLLYSPQDSTR